ncbi:MAG: hypothetical protein K6F35_05485 [Lachnospiraceae bacterium]|nr:hypothetical protein [Lachnospiraceae bacterium]
MTVGVVFVCLISGWLAVLSVNRIAADIIDKEYKDKAEQIAEAVAGDLDPEDVLSLTDTVMDIYYGLDTVVPSTEWGSDAWNEYMSHYEGIEDLEVFQRVRDQLRLYQDIFKVDCIYLMNYQTNAGNAIYVADGAYGEEACPPGVVDSFAEGIWPDEDDAPIPATITDEDVYGWLVTAAFPVKHNGKFVVHLCVDVSMNDIRAKERGYVVTTTLVMILLTILLLAVSLWYVSTNVIKPVKMLSDTARNYCAENNDVVHHAFEKLQIGTHDEIAQLLASMKQMEADMNSNIDTLVDTKVALKKSEAKADAMQALAVKDALTGVRNKTAYDYEAKKLRADMADGFEEFGLAIVDLNGLKKTNDTTGMKRGIFPSKGSARWSVRFLSIPRYSVSAETSLP